MIAHAHIPKTGGTTLKAILRRTFGKAHFDTGWPREMGWLTVEELRRVQLVYRNLKSLAGHGISPTDELHEAFPDIRHYTFLRDPIRRTLSDFQFIFHCQFKKSGEPPHPTQFLDQFMEANRNRQTKHLAGVEDADTAIEIIRQRVGFVGLVEHFDESLIMLKKWAKLPHADFSYKSLNVSAERMVEGQYLLRDLMQKDKSISAQIEYINREDTKLYKFVCDEIYPAQLASYGTTLDDDVGQFLASNSRVRFFFRDSLSGKAYRNLIFKPLQPFLLPERAA